jgi:hypothetical protein
MLRQAEFVAAHQMLTHVQARLAGALNVQHCSVLPREVGAGCDFLANPGHTAFYRGGFVQQYIVSHTCFLVGQCRGVSWGAG